jgi:hypothetical protein
MRRAEARASPASSAPRKRPIIACPAMAIASSDNPRNRNTWNAI